MSFTVGFRSSNARFADGNPYTFEANGSPPRLVEPGLTDAERAAVLTFLRGRGMFRLGTDDRVRATLSGGTPVVVNLAGLLTTKPCVGGTVAADEFSRPLVNFVFDLAHVGGMIFALENHQRPFATTLAAQRRMMAPCPGVQIATSSLRVWHLVAPPEEPPSEAKSPNLGDGES